MPSTLKVRVVCARDLPVMDRKTSLADPFVTMRLGDMPKASTSIARKTLNPVWNELFRFEIVNDVSLQDQPLEITVWSLTRTRTLTLVTRTTNTTADSSDTHREIARCSTSSSTALASTMTGNSIDRQGVSDEPLIASSLSVPPPYPF